MVKRNRGRRRLKVSADGRGVVGHAGARLLSDLADQLGLTNELSAAMAPTKQRRREHDRGHVLVDLAVMIADGGTAISDLAVLRDQPNLFGEVASTPTAWRTLEAVDDAALARIATARAAVRRRVWAAGADSKFSVIDFDATLITSHSDKTEPDRRTRKVSGFIRCSRSWTEPVKHSPGSCARAMPDRTLPPITSPFSMLHSPSFGSTRARWK